MRKQMRFRIEWEGSPQLGSVILILAERCVGAVLTPTEASSEATP